MLWERAAGSWLPLATYSARGWELCLTGSELDSRELEDVFCAGVSLARLPAVHTKDSSLPTQAGRWRKQVSKPTGALMDLKATSSSKIPGGSRPTSCVAGSVLPLSSSGILLMLYLASSEGSTFPTHKLRPQMKRPCPVFTTLRFSCNRQWSCHGDPHLATQLAPK